MKYIRTSDKILENKMNMRFADRKQADTIEELCDAFVYAKCDYMELEEAKCEKEWNESDWQQDGLPIYGAIWTDKGLIYVAKMNEKGELELL